MEYGTIKIPKDEYKKHNERRQDLGVTWAEYIDGNAPNPDGVDTEALVSDLKAELPPAVASEVAKQLR